MDLDGIRDRLATFVGAREADRLIALCVDATGLARVSTPGQSLTFAEALCKQGGVAAVVGRSLKAKAILRGASVSTVAA